MSAHGGIAVVGMACRYPDAASPTELWENVLARRAAFRRLPRERLPLADYHDPDPAAPDRTYATEAAVLTDWRFARERFRVPASTVRATDLTHWLALDVAAAALADAGYPDADGAPRDTTLVVIGNSLAGEFSRVGTLRLRWPYVRRVVDAALAEAGWDRSRRVEWLESLEARYKAPFPPVDGDTLAGGLANTIAGRVCNQFGLRGGGYTVDGACASSLLAVATACTALTVGDADLALAGGVDLSLDPFELVGFAKAGALATEAMRVYDARAEGFWPGEGCGVVALMREADARAEGRRVHAVVRGWGVSSDGHGGITRPTVGGQRLAVDRAYRRAPFRPDAVGYFEGHGTATPVGDATELAVLGGAWGDARAGREDPDGAFPGRPAVGSVKALIGHTKAAAGVAGLIKAAVTVRERVIPPSAGCDVPHDLLRGEHAVLRAPTAPEAWPSGVVARAGVSAMGFGGINAHVVLEEARDAGRPPAVRALPARVRLLADSHQSCEVLMLAAPDIGTLARQAAALADRVAGASRAELGDLAAALATRASAPHAVIPGARGAVVATSPAEGAARLRALGAAVAASRVDGGPGVFVGVSGAAPRVGLLCSGQGGPVPTGFGLLGHRFPDLDAMPGEWIAPDPDDPTATEVAQPNVVRASLGGLHVLTCLGIAADVALGHSLGELVALHWSGALDAPATWRIARARGAAMAACDGPRGAMAGIAASSREAGRLVAGTGAVVAGHNGPRQSVVAGDTAAIDTVVARARREGIGATRLAVSHAFHSPLVAPAADAVARAVARETVLEPSRPVASTVTGAVLPRDVDVRALLRTQVAEPVRFAEAFATVADRVDLWIEIGPGDVLCGLARSLGPAPALPLRVGADDALSLCAVVGAAFALGVLENPGAPFRHRFTRAADLDRRPTFLASPCELVPAADAARADGARAAADEAARAQSSATDRATAAAPVVVASDGPPALEEPAGDPLDVVRRVVAARADLPLDTVCPTDRLLADLHLSSIAVGEIVVAAARALALDPSEVPTEYANATVAEVAAALGAVRAAPGGTTGGAPVDRAPAGVAAWVRAFAPALVARPRSAPPAARRAPTPRGWTVLARPGHPLASAIRERLEGAVGGGTVVCVGSDGGRDEGADVPLLLLGVAAAARARGDPFVVVHDGRAHGAAAFARSVHLERPGSTTCIVAAPPGLPDAAAAVRAEVLAARGFVEAHLRPDGGRVVPVLRAHPLAADDPAALRALLGAGAVVLVTGGGRGIGAECALDLARATGAALLLLGRAARSDDGVRATLARMRDANVDARYHRADVTDAAAVRAAVRAAESLGPITAVIHAAGVNEPALSDTLDAEMVTRALAPKLAGARAVLAALDPPRLRLWVSFGSVIGRVGLAGEAHYAYANAMLAAFTDDLQRRLPNCRCRCVEWSVWAGVGMGERLGRVEALARAGVTPVGIDDGVWMLRRVLADSECPTSVVVSGRLGDPPTASLDGPPLPLHRFLERPRVWYPGIELVADVDVGRASDPYLDDHAFGDERIVPAVLALEAMAQVVDPLAAGRRVVAVEALELLRSLVVPADGHVTLRLAAIVREDGAVDVAIRSAATGFAVDHVRARWRLASPDPHAAATAAVSAAPGRDAEGGVGAAAHAGADAAPLYASMLFQRGRFRRLAAYRTLEATSCRAIVTPAPDATGAPWFGEYAAGTLLLGDPGARDACLHAVQACVPHLSLLPVGADLVELVAPEAAVFAVTAREVARTGDVFTYDIDVAGSDDRVVERWRGVRFRVVAGALAPDRRPAIVLGPHAERRLGQILAGAQVRVALVSAATRDAGRVAALGLLGHGDVTHRADGRPDAADGATISVAHATRRGGVLTLVSEATGVVGCDLEPAVPRAADTWPSLLGVEGTAVARVLARALPDGDPSAPTRVWAAHEALRKAGASRAPLVVERVEADGWAVLRADDLIVATWCAYVVEHDAPIAVAVAARPAARLADGLGPARAALAAGAR